MYDHYINSYEYHSKSTKTNKLVDEVLDNLKPTYAEWLKMAKHAQELEIELEKAKNRISNLGWSQPHAQRWGY